MRWTWLFCLTTDGGRSEFAVRAHIPHHAADRHVPPVSNYPSTARNPMHDSLTTSQHRLGLHLTPTCSLTHPPYRSHTHQLWDVSICRRKTLRQLSPSPSPSRGEFKLRANGGTTFPHQNPVFGKCEDSDRQIFPIRAEESSPKGGFASKQIPRYDVGDPPHPLWCSQVEDYHRNTIQQALHGKRIDTS